MTDDIESTAGAAANKRKLFRNKKSFPLTPWRSILQITCIMFFACLIVYAILWWILNKQWQVHRLNSVELNTLEYEDPPILINYGEEDE